jgi:ABC-type uncharacterized transport system permease subunit
MSSSGPTLPNPRTAFASSFQKVLNVLGMPLLAILAAFLLGGLVIWVTSGSLITVFQAYSGMLEGAFFKERGLSETLVSTIPYIFLSLALAVGFKTGLFNIGADGQFYIGAITGALVGQAFSNLPAIIHLPLTLVSAAVGGAIWAGIPGFLKARTGAHEVVTTIMMNYIAYRLTELLVTIFKDPNTTAIQTRGSAPSAWIWSLYSLPQRLQDPLNALGTALFLGLLSYLLARWVIGRTSLKNRFKSHSQKRLVYSGFALLIGLLTFFLLPVFSKILWPFTDPYDRLHIGLFLALLASILIWWLLWKTTLGFELRTVGANPYAARYAGMNITRNIVLAMAISGALAAIAGSIQVLGVSSCHCQQVLFTPGLGFDAIAIALLAKNDPFGILAAAFLFGAMHNGSSLMEINSGVSHYVVSLIQGFALLFVAAPAILRSVIWFRNQRAKTEDPAVRRSGG